MATGAQDLHGAPDHTWMPCVPLSILWRNWTNRRFYTHTHQRYLLQGIGSHNYEGWEVSQSQFKAKGREDWWPSLKTVRQRVWILPYSVFLFNSGLRQIEWDPPTMTKATYFTQSTSNVNLIQKRPHRYTQNTVWPNIRAPRGPVKLAHKMNHPTLNWVTASRLQGPRSATRAKLYFIKSNWLRHENGLEREKLETKTRQKVL